MIDQGATLIFHHNWDDYRTRSDPHQQIRHHVLLRWATEIRAVDEELAARLTPERIAGVIDLIPASWLGDEPRFSSVDEHRAAYREYLTRRPGAPEGAGAVGRRRGHRELPGGDPEGLRRRRRRRIDREPAAAGALPLARGAAQHDHPDLSRAFGRPRRSEDRARQSVREARARAEDSLKSNAPRRQVLTLHDSRQRSQISRSFRQLQTLRSIDARDDPHTDMEKSAHGYRLIERNCPCLQFAAERPLFRSTTISALRR